MNERLLFRYRVSLGMFIAGLVLSGLTAFPLVSELSILHRILGSPAPQAIGNADTMHVWLGTVHRAVTETDARFPFLFYGTDWLAFGHLVIALFFVGPLVRPRGNEWVLYAGLVACVGVIVIALVCGAIRGIPWFWQMIDCSFGALGAIPLLYCLRVTRRIDNLRVS